MFLLSIVFGLSFNVFAQDSWEGDWTGDCEIKRMDGTSETRSIEFTSELQNSGHWSWDLKWGRSTSRQSEVRRYQLRANEHRDGHFYLEESNGIFLDAYFDNDKFRIPYLDRGQLVIVNYHFNGDYLNIEVPYFTDRPIRKTCSRRSPSRCSYTLGMYGYEQCYLQRGGVPTLLPKPLTKLPSQRL